jgi:hypothetical protein
MFTVGKKGGAFSLWQDYCEGVRCCLRCWYMVARNAINACLAEKCWAYRFYFRPPVSFHLTVHPLPAPGERPFPPWSVHGFYEPFLFLFSFHILVLNSSQSIQSAAPQSKVWTGLTYEGELLRFCGVCGKSFKKPSDANRHVTGHTKERPFNCAFCTWGSARRDLLAKHVQRHHSPAWT